MRFLLEIFSARIRDFLRDADVFCVKGEVARRVDDSCVARLGIHVEDGGKLGGARRQDEQVAVGAEERIAMRAKSRLDRRRRFQVHVNKRKILD